MTRVAIRPFRPGDRERLIAAITDLQDFERALHDTRRPGVDSADAYFAMLETQIDTGAGALLVAEIDGAFAGWVGCFVVHNDNPAETPDSNVYGYVSDVYVAPERRGRRVAQNLLSAAERHLAEQGVRRVRIGSLAANAAAQAAYTRSGFTPYEVLFEKRLAGPD
jgi:ribosomal protein S18 acetylase RimI-like enzyme